jgi:hypothetical protein
VNVTGRPKGLEVTGGGRGITSHAGLGLLRRLADATGLTPGADLKVLTLDIVTASASYRRLTCGNAVPREESAAGIRTPAVQI